MAEREKYIIAAVEKAVRVENYLSQGDLLAYKSAAEVARGAFVTPNEAYRILKTLASCGRVEQAEHGFRVGRNGLAAIAVYVQEYLARHLEKTANMLGIRRT